MEKKELYEEITETIISAALKIHNTLGCGFLEKVYENALVHEMRKRGLQVETQKPIQVVYDDIIVGDYKMDIIVEGKVIVELKASGVIEEVHKAQLLNYLRACNLRLGLIFNFSKPRLQVKRMVYGF
ncbi:MAG: GxxExxY protein [bacterium]